MPHVTPVSDVQPTHQSLSPIDYGAKGDGVSDDSVAIRNTFAAATPGTEVFFPNGTYLISHFNSTYCLRPPDNIRIRGQSKAGTIIKMADAQPDGVRMFWPSATSNLEICDLTIDGNVANQADTTGLLHGDVIFLDNMTRIRIHDVEIKNATASGIVVWQNSADVEIEHCYIHDCGWMGISLGDAKGQKEVAIRDCDLKGNRGGFHIETSGNSDSVTVERTYMDATTGNAACNIVGQAGSDATAWTSNIAISDCEVVGFVDCSAASGVVLDHVKITNSDTATGNTPHHYSSIIISGDVRDIVVDDCTIVHSATATGLEAILVAGNSRNDCSGIVITDNHISVAGSASDAICLQSTAGVTITGNRIYGNSSLALQAFYGINIYNRSLPVVGSVRIHSNYIADFPIGIVCHAAPSSPTYHINEISLIDNEFESLTAGLMTGCISLDFDGQHLVQAATARDNRILNASVSTMFATYANVPMLIGGNRNSVGDWIGSGAPSFSAAKGSTYRRLDGGAGTCLYVNESGSTTWVSK